MLNFNHSKGDRYGLSTICASSSRALEKNGELKRIPFEVDPVLEITEFADRAVKRGGPALLFEKPKGSRHSGADQRLRLACARWRSRSKSISVEEVAARISEFLEMRMPEGLIGKLKMLPKLAEMGAFFPKIVSNGPCQEVVRTRRLLAARLPHAAMLAARTAAASSPCRWCSRANPDTGKRNCGMYRMQVFDERTTGMHWQTHKQGAEHYRRTAAARRASAWTWRWPSAPTRPPCTRPSCRCRPTSTR